MVSISTVEKPQMRKVRHWQPAPILLAQPTPYRPLTQAEMVERINLIRAEAGPLHCTMCGSTTPNVAEHKRCPACFRVLPVVAFARRTFAADGRQAQCRECRNPVERSRMAELRKRRALEAVS